MDQLWGALNTTNGLLSAIGLVLLAICLIAWRRANRAERTPNPEQLDQIRDFVEGHFARYVARGMAAEGVDSGTIDVANDRAWQKVYVQHLRLNSELYAFRTAVALDIFKQSIDEAVRRELAALTAAGAPTPA